MKRKNLFMISIFAFMLSSFSSSTTTRLLAGTYSTCGCENLDSNEKKFGLTLNQDNTFHYFDYTNTNVVKDVRGDWNIEKNIIKLTNYDSSFKIENRWKVEKDGKCIKSKLGLKFTRICNVTTCN